MHARASIGKVHPGGTLRTMFDATPDPIAFSIGTFAVYWYGISYAVGLVAVYFLLTRLAKRAGRNPELVGNGMVVVAIAALIGGRLYHVIDQWERYAGDPLRIILPPYSGLGVFGGIVTGTIVAAIYIRRKGEPFWTWADIIAPGLFLMQAVGRWGNFFNQELYGPPTDLPWGIPIDCVHRVPEYVCAVFPEATTRFHPLFLYESLSGFLGMAFLVFLGTRFGRLLRPGDLLLIFFVWYGVVRMAVETLRQDPWTVLGVPTAMIVSALFIAGGLAVLLYRHRPGRSSQVEPPTFGTADQEADEEPATPGPASPPAG
jgi:phosphatidylglycerol---prolipoprotein diacylglyceryl transferase